MGGFSFFCLASLCHQMLIFDADLCVFCCCFCFSVVVVLVFWCGGSSVRRW